MPVRRDRTSNRTLLAVLALTLVATALVFAIIARREAQAPPPDTPPSTAVEIPAAATATAEGDPVTRPMPDEAPGPSVIDFNALETDEALQGLMQRRKARYGVREGVDLIVRSDETLRVGVSTVRMQEILDKAFISRGEVVERSIGESEEEIPAPGVAEYGIYVVQPGDNIWNIHYALVREYFQGSGAPLPEKADEPDMKGRSSGVGKLLKFSEKMVYIYNLADRRIDVDIHLIQPLTKLVVYNMDEVFRLVEEIGIENLHRIQFDGETIWLPAS